MKAGQGGAQALFGVMDLIEMTGRTDELSEQEQRRRRIELPGSYSSDDYDLLTSPAREKERQSHLANSDDNETYVLMSEGKLDEAFAMLRRNLANSKGELANDPSNPQTRDKLDSAISGIGLIA